MARHFPANIHMFSMCLLLMLAVPVRADHLHLGTESNVQAGGIDILVPGYSVPQFVDFNGDALPDLVVGEGGGDILGRVRVYLNDGAAGAPSFSDYFHVQAGGQELTEVPGACHGTFPRVVYWDDDDRKDLLIGVADGTIKIYLNTGTDQASTFDSGTLLEVG